MKITPRILAISTVSIIATIATLSTALAYWSMDGNVPSGHTCTPLSSDTYGFGYSSGYGGNGYGFECQAPNPGGGSTSGPGGMPSSPATPSNPSGNPGPTPPVTPIFPSFTVQCTQSLKDLTDSRLVGYLANVLKVQDLSNIHRPLTRAEFVKLVIDASGVDVSNEADPTFVDVPSNHSLKKYIAYAERMGTVNGSQTHFRPDDTISRAEAAKTFANAAGLAPATNIHTFSDVPASLSLAPYIQASYDGCLLNGRKTLGGETLLPNGERIYEPHDIITVAETAKVLFNIANR